MDLVLHEAGCMRISKSSGKADGVVEMREQKCAEELADAGDDDDLGEFGVVGLVILLEVDLLGACVECREPVFEYELDDFRRETRQIEADG